MTEPTDRLHADLAASMESGGIDDSTVGRPAAEFADPESAPTEDAPEAVRPIRPRPRRQRGPALVVAALLVGAGVFLALRGMQQVVARAPVMPAPTTAPSPAPATLQPSPSPTPRPTPMPTSSPIILLP
jgi:hypothetical protein